MKFEEFVCFEATVPELQSQDRNGAIAELVSALTEAGRLPADASDEITKAVIKRENEASTGMGKGMRPTRYCWSATWFRRSSGFSPRLFWFPWALMPMWTMIWRI